ncbi:Hypothetical predicted protein [Octopus vulgaris]|uniref:Uncharacterized protein n=2 Tax=Octopus TaxID=6643 RepID=A0AA36ASK1_OCTVU|nr:uncharacterized protein LOC115210621 [Octopus sinensis]CAI9721503.1 Hypothetical predicted protein [Octopus vulgaris]
MRTGVDLDSHFENLDMTLSCCRKRPRNLEDEFDESIPISKRINSLYIEGRPDCSHESTPSPDPPVAENNHPDQNYKLWQQQQFHHLPPQVDCLNNTQSKLYSEASGSSANMSAAIANHPHPYNPQQQTPNSFLDTRHTADHTVIKKYEPELDESSNPFYYRINEVLFKAHAARIGRLTKTSPSDSSHFSFSR